jgi:hypothetical protein
MHSVMLYYSCYHRHNLANKTDWGAGGNQLWVLGTSVYEVVNLERVEGLFEPVLNVHTQLYPLLFPHFFFGPSSIQ